jgi:hypothetical protein
VSQAIVGEVSISRKMDGASELSFTLSDPDGKIRRSRFLSEATRFSIDELGFALVQVSKTGLDLTLTAEDAVVYRLRQKKGPKKAYRDKMTRAEFAKSLVREVGKDIEFVSPDLTKVQPVVKQKRSASRAVDDNRGAGIPANASGLTVKGSPANATQKGVADRIIRAALTYDPPHRALVAVLCAATHESVMGTLGMNTAVDHDSIGILQGRLMYNSRKDLQSIPYNVRRFFNEPWTGTSAGGAIKQAKAGRSIGDICTSIQGNATGDVYTQWKDEAEKWIAAYQGGSSESTTVTTTKRYAFQVAKNENYWEALKRLAEEVNWRCFVVGKRVYFIAEPTLFRSRRRMLIGEDSPGIEFVDWDIDSGKKAHTASVSARVANWQAPPGTVVVLDKSQGPAQGRWLVETIDGSLNFPDVSISLKRPSKPKPEPASETSTETVGGSQGSSGGSGGADKAVRWAKNAVGVTQGSSKYNTWMAAVDGADPWCSDFITYIMQEVCGLNIGSGNWHHSSFWLTWSNADRVSESSIKPGDIVVYDWGDGGETDHVALYIGGGKRIGGNESDAVRENPATLSSAVGIVRPKYK